jgi:hypothetical protein
MSALVRRRLTERGQLSEPLVRSAAGALAELMAGGANGWSWDYGEAAGSGYDPEQWFATVTEGRQCRWRDRTGRWRAYSACEDLFGAVYLRLCGMPPALEELQTALDWCNRTEAGNSWVPGYNLLRLKKRAPHLWRTYEAGQVWDIEPGDAVQIQGNHGPHTFVVLTIHGAGHPVEMDHADYGQLHQPHGASRADHSCRCHYGASVAQVNRRWVIDGKPVIGRVSCWEVVQHVAAAAGRGGMLPAWVPNGFSGGQPSDNPYLPEYGPDCEDTVP